MGGLPTIFGRLCDSVSGLVVGRCAVSVDKITSTSPSSFDSLSACPSRTLVRLIPLRGLFRPHPKSVCQTLRWSLSATHN